MPEDVSRVAVITGAGASGRLRLVIPPGALMRRMVKLLGIDQLLAVYSTVTEACAA